MDRSQLIGYVDYRDALSLTSQFYFCGVPFRLDTTAKCTLNCLYCFAMARGGRRSSRQLLVDPQRLARKLEGLFAQGRAARDAVDEMLKRRVPIHFGGISEPFADAVISRVSTTLLDTFGGYDYPIVLSTKNPAVLVCDETLARLKRFKHLVVQLSLTTLSDHLAQRIEPKAPSPARRLQCLEMLSSNGIHCVCRLQPLVYTGIAGVVQDLIPRLAETGCKHVVVEFLKLPVEHRISLVKVLLDSLGWDAYEFYRGNGATLVGREWLLPARFKWENLQPVVEAIRRHGMTYGAGDYGLHHLGDTDCCCGLDGMPGFSNWFRGNFSNVIRNASSSTVTLGELSDHWYPQASVKRVLNSNCRLDGDHHAILDYLKSKWNSPGTANAPDQFLGIEWCGDYDEQGNCVYKRREVV